MLQIIGICFFFLRVLLKLFLHFFIIPKSVFFEYYVRYLQIFEYVLAKFAFYMSVNQDISLVLGIYFT